PVDQLLQDLQSRQRMTRFAEDPDNVAGTVCQSLLHLGRQGVLDGLPAVVGRRRLEGQLTYHVVEGLLLLGQGRHLLRQGGQLPVNRQHMVQQVGMVSRLCRTLPQARNSLPGQKAIHVPKRTYPEPLRPWRNRAACCSSMAWWLACISW